MSKTPTEQDHTPVFREIDLSAETRRVWGSQWDAPDLAYEFVALDGSVRRFYQKTGDAGIYSGATVSGGSALEDEAGESILDETSELLIDERAGP